MRLIDADALIEWIDVGHLRHPSELCYSELDVVNMINHRPTIEERNTGTCTGCVYEDYIEEPYPCTRCIRSADGDRYEEKEGEDDEID